MIKMVPGKRKKHRENNRPRNFTVKSRLLYSAAVFMLPLNFIKSTKFSIKLSSEKINPVGRVRASQRYETLTLHTLVQRLLPTLRLQGREVTGEGNFVGIKSRCHDGGYPLGFRPCPLGLRSGFESPDLDTPGRLPHQQGLCHDVRLSINCFALGPRLSRAPGLTRLYEIEGNSFS